LLALAAEGQTVGQTRIGVGTGSTYPRGGDVTLSEADLQRVEATFSITLPPGYRRLVIQGGPLPSGVEWVDTADALIELNMDFLGEPHWDAAYFAIASTGTGDHYCVELDSPDVVFYSHEDRQFSELGRFTDWIESPDEQENGATNALRLLGCLAVLTLLGLIFAIPIYLAFRASH
jgi:hypothetical protein